jgi:hypothetical protein
MSRDAALDLRGFDALTAARGAATALSDSGMLSAHEHDHVLGVTNHINQALAIKRERGDAERDLEILRERWPDWDFRTEGEDWIARTKDGLCILRSAYLAVLNKEMQREEEENWELIHGHRGESADGKRGKREALVDDETVADGLLDKVAAYLIAHGLHVKVFIDDVPPAGQPGSIGVLSPVTGQYAQIIHGTTREGQGGTFLELIYRTAQDEDPDGKNMAERVIHLLSAAAIPDQM